MGFLKFLKHRATRIVIELLFLAMSAVAMFNTIVDNQIDYVLAFILLFATANILHLIFDRLWSWMCVMPFILVYEVFLWINFAAIYSDALDVKYSTENRIYATILVVGLSIALLLIIYLLKPRAKASTK